jgi:hypothetical protein
MHVVVETENVNSPGFIKKCNNATWFLDKKEMVTEHERKNRKQ